MPRILKEAKDGQTSAQMLEASLSRGSFLNPPCVPHLVFIVRSGAEPLCE
jgi:hypothetical protein